MAATAWKRRKLGTAVTVVTGEELRRQQIRHAADALRNLPGVTVSRTGGFAGETQVRIRGAEANHTLVMIDGVIANPHRGAEHELDAADVGSTLRDRRLWVVCGASGLYVVPQVALMGFLVLFLHDAHGFSTGAAAAVLAVSQVLAAGLRIGVGRWSDVLGSRVGRSGSSG